MIPGGALNIPGVDDPELTAAIVEFKAAPDLESQKAALTKLQEIHNRVVPFVVTANMVEYIVVDESVKGITPTLHSTVFFDGAFIEE